MKFKPEDFAGLVSSPPQAMQALTDERMRDEIASIQALGGKKLNIKLDMDLGLDEAEEESGNG